MSTALTTTSAEEIIEQLIIGGDISKLNTQQRLQYYHHFCERLGIDPMSQSIQYLELQKKLTLYVTAKACDQIADKRKINRRIVDVRMLDDVYLVIAEATDASGRIEQSTGASVIGGLFGDNKINAMLKAESKAKRRAVISFTGLGVMAEEEADSIPGARKVSIEEVHGSRTNPHTGEITTSAPVKQLNGRAASMPDPATITFADQPEPAADQKAYSAIHDKIAQLTTAAGDKIIEFGDLVRVTEGMTRREAIAQYKALEAAIETQVAF